MDKTQNIQSGRSLTAAFPGKYIQGENALAGLPDLVKLLGKNGLIIASPTVKDQILPRFHLNEPASGSC